MADPITNWAKDQAVNLAEDWLVDLATKAGQSAQMTLERRRRSG